MYTLAEIAHWKWTVTVYFEVKWSSVVWSEVYTLDGIVHFEVNCNRAFWSELEKCFEMSWNSDFEVSWNSVLKWAGTLFRNELYSVFEVSWNSDFEVSWNTV